MRYASVEYTYAEPIAAALARIDRFREWLLIRSPFFPLASDARLLVDEMAAKRSKNAQNWWGSHYNEICRCGGCSGQETDLLAIFESQASARFAIHFEVKQPKDRFPTVKDQAANYRQRASCWATNPPRSVVQHCAAATGLFFSERKRDAYAAHIAKFDFALTFEEIADQFPEINLPLQL